MMLYLPLVYFRDETMRAIESRYGSLERLDEWLAQRDRDEVEPGTMPPLGMWEARPSFYPSPGVVDVLSWTVSPRLLWEQMLGPAPSDLDENGNCRCDDCRSARTQPFTVAVIRAARETLEKRQR